MIVRHPCFFFPSSLSHVTFLLISYFRFVWMSFLFKLCQSSIEYILNVSTLTYEIYMWSTRSTRCSTNNSIYFILLTRNKQLCKLHKLFTNCFTLHIYARNLTTPVRVYYCGKIYVLQFGAHFVYPFRFRFKDAVRSISICISTSTVRQIS